MAISTIITNSQVTQHSLANCRLFREMMLKEKGTQLELLICQLDSFILSTNLIKSKRWKQAWRQLKAKVCSFQMSDNLNIIIKLAFNLVFQINISMLKINFKLSFITFELTGILRKRTKRNVGDTRITSNQDVTTLALAVDNSSSVAIANINSSFNSVFVSIGQNNFPTHNRYDQSNHPSSYGDEDE